LANGCDIWAAALMDAALIADWGSGLIAGWGVCAPALLTAV